MDRISGPARCGGWSHGGSLVSSSFYIFRMSDIHPPIIDFCQILTYGRHKLVFSVP